MDNVLQIDVLNMRSGANTNAAEMLECNLYTGGRVVKIYMNPIDYKLLILDGFFIRNGKQADSADVLNTTAEYIKKGGNND